MVDSKMEPYMLLALICYFALATTADNVTIHAAFISDIQVLTCHSTDNHSIGWFLRTTESGQEFPVGGSYLPTYKVNRNATDSWVTFTVESYHAGLSLSCKSNGETLRTYNIEKTLNLSSFTSPRCEIVPATDGNTFNVTGINYTCKTEMSQGITPILNLQGQASNADGLAVKVVTIGELTQIQNISCQMSVYEKKHFRNCTFPAYVEIKSSCTEQGEAIFECDIDEDSEITWYFLDMTYDKKFVSDPWFRDQGKTLLLRNSTELGNNRVITCQQNAPNNAITTVGFGKISCVQSSGSNSNTSSTPDSMPHRPTAYVYLAFIMVCLWLVTLGAIISWCGYSKRKKEDYLTRSETRVRTSSRRNELSSNTDEPAVPTRHDINKIGESKNQNNSALHHDDQINDVYEGIAIGAANKEGTDARDDCDRVYFCLERSSTSSTKSSMTSDHGKETALHLDERLRSVRSPTLKRDNSDTGCYEEVRGNITKSNEIPVNLTEVGRCNEELIPLYSTVHK